MTYRFELQNPLLNEIDQLPWFLRSYGTITDWEYRDVDDVDQDYQDKFKVKFVYGEPKGPRQLKPIIAIDFPSEGDAVMFMLRWA